MRYVEGVGRRQHFRPAVYSPIAFGGKILISKREIGLTLVGLAVGLIVIWIIRMDISINLFWGVLLVTTGAIIGFVIEWVIDEAYRHDPSRRQRLIEQTGAPQPAAEVTADPPDLLQQREAEIQRLQAELTRVENELESLRTTSTPSHLTYPDDLTVIKGIGLVYQRKLRDLGIRSYHQLAGTDPEQLRQMLAIYPWQKVDIASWVEQAGRLANQA